MKEWIKITLFFAVLIIVLACLTMLGEEKPHKIMIDGKEYVRMTEWTGNHYQVIILPVDSVSHVTK